MAKRKITYDDGSVVFEEIPEAQSSTVVKGLEKLDNTLPGTQPTGWKATAPLPKRLDPAQQTTLSDQFGNLVGSLFADPLDQLGAGIHDAAQKNATVDTRLGGIANALKGGGQLALSTAGASGGIPSTLKGIVKTGLGIGGGILGNKAGLDLSKRLGAGPGGQELAGVGGAVVGGGIGSKVPDIALSDALALKSGGLLGLGKKLLLGSGQPASEKPATGSAAPKTATSTTTYADPSKLATTVTGTPVSTRLPSRPLPKTQPVGSTPLNPPKAPAAPKPFGPPADNMAEIEPWNEQVRAERAASLSSRARTTAAQTEASREGGNANTQMIRDQRSNVQSTAAPKPVKPAPDTGDSFRRQQDAIQAEGLRQDSAGRWMKNGKLVQKTYMQKLADQYGFKDWQ